MDDLFPNNPTQQSGITTPDPVKATLDWLLNAPPGVDLRPANLHLVHQRFLGLGLHIEPGSGRILPYHAQATKLRGAICENALMRWTRKTQPALAQVQAAQNDPAWNHHKKGASHAVDG